MQTSALSGTGNSTPVVSQTILDNQTGVSSSGIETYGSTTSSPYYGYKIFTFRFNQGIAAGNISEIGVGWTGTTPLQLFSRTLIKDINGDPTTITVLADETLDVIYELRLYAPETDLIVSGLDFGESTHDLTIRSATISSAYWSAFIGNSRFSWTDNSYGYNGSLGLITGLPSGTSAYLGNYNIAAAAYVQNSNRSLAQLTVALNNGNLSGGISALTVFTYLGAYQIGFNPPVLKTNQKIFKLNLELSWGRYAP